MPDKSSKKPEKLRHMLEQLHGELERTKSVDKDTRALLEDLMQDAQELIEDSGDDLSPRHRSFDERLKEAIQHFEQTHPKLTLTMARVIDALKGLGV